MLWWGDCGIINLRELMFARKRRAMAVGAAQGDRVFSEVKRLCYAGLDEATLLREVADRLRRAVPFEGYCANAVDPLSGLISNAIPEEMGGEKEARFFLEHLYFAEDVNEYNHLVRSPVALLSETIGAGLSVPCATGS